MNKAQKVLSRMGSSSGSTAPRYLTVAMPTKIAREVRRTMRAPGYGHRAERELASGFGPCRHCLREFDVNAEDRILFTYDPFEAHGAYPLPGPVFIHAEECDPYPRDGGLPSHLEARKSSLLAYGGSRRLVAEIHAEGEAIERGIQGLFALPTVDYIHMRNLQAGCFTAAFERNGGG